MTAPIKMVFTTLLLAGLVTAGCSQEPKSATGHVVKIQLTSAAFADGRPIPAKYTGDALDISPPLAWTNAPAGTKSFALITDDPHVNTAVQSNCAGASQMQPVWTFLAGRVPRRKNFAGSF